MMAAGGLGPDGDQWRHPECLWHQRHLGAGDWMVVEADESDGTFVKLPATAAVVTNIDPEHLDHYGSFDAVREAFLDFRREYPFLWLSQRCAWIIRTVQALAAKVQDRRIVTYGFNRQADVYGAIRDTLPDGVRFDVEYRANADAEPQRLLNLSLPMVGNHNVQNALAAVAIALRLGITEDAIREGLAGFCRCQTAVYQDG